MAAAPSAPASPPSPPAAPAPAPSAPPRKSRVLKRKTDHSLIERRRREKINERLVRLQTLVPACYAEALDVLRAKPLPAARRRAAQRRARAQASQRQVPSRRPLPDDNEPGDWTMDEMTSRIQGDMVLEKLCIISHTYDYVCELRQQLAEYQRLCSSLVPSAAGSTDQLSTPAARDALALKAPVERPQPDLLAKAKHYAFAHALTDEAAAESSLSDRASAPDQPEPEPASPTSMQATLSGSNEIDVAQENSVADKEPTALEDVAASPPPPQPSNASAGFPLCCPSHRRRAQRFWGSDHPIPILPQSAAVPAPGAEASPRSSLSSVACGDAALVQPPTEADNAPEPSPTHESAPRVSAVPRTGDSKGTGSVWSGHGPCACPAGPAPPSPCSSTSSLAFDEDEELTRVQEPVRPTLDKSLASPMIPAAKMPPAAGRSQTGHQASPTLASPAPSGGERHSSAPSLKRPLETEDTPEAKRPRSLSPLIASEKRESAIEMVRNVGQSSRSSSPPAHQHHHHHHYYMHILPPPGGSSASAVTKGDSPAVVALAPTSGSQASQPGPRPHIHLALAPMTSPPRGTLPFHPPPAPARPLGSHPHLHSIQRPGSRPSQDRLHLLAHLAQPAPSRRCGSE